MDDISQPGFINRAADAAPDASRPGEHVTSALRAAVDRMTATLKDARQPGQPLDVVASITREAPLSALLVALLLGMAAARRR